jgi:error-prone DNA polymerase
VGRRIVQPTGFAMSPYSDIGHAGPAVRRPPKATLWHTSPGSSGPTP